MKRWWRELVAFTYGNLTALIPAMVLSLANACPVEWGTSGIRGKSAACERNNGAHHCNRVGGHNRNCRCVCGVSDFEGSGAASMMMELRAMAFTTPSPVQRPLLAKMAAEIAKEVGL